MVVPKEGGVSREENCGLRTPSWFPPLNICFEFIKLEIKPKTIFFPRYQPPEAPPPPKCPPPPEKLLPEEPEEKPLLW